MRPLGVIVAIVLLAGIGFVLLASRASAEGRLPTALPDEFGLPTALVPLDREKIVLPSDSIVRRDVLSGENVDTVVRLSWTKYQAYWLRSRSGEVDAKSGRLICYELGSESPYAWAYWTASPNLGNFRLLTLAEGKTYLAWVEASFVRLADVSESRTSCVALMAYFHALPDSTILVPVQELVPRASHWGVNALYAGIVCSSLERVGKDGLRLTIIDEEGTDKAELLYDGSKWSLAPEGDGVGKP